MAILHDNETVEEFDAQRAKFPAAKAAIAGLCLLATLWLARDVSFGRWVGLTGDAPPPGATARPAAVAAPAVTASGTTPPATGFVPPQQILPPSLQTTIAAPAVPAASDPPPVGTDPTRATLIDQIGAPQMQLVLARLKRDLAQAQAETSKLGGDTGADGVEALLDRMADRDGARPRGLAVQAVFGRDGDWAARLTLPCEGSRVVRRGEVLNDRWRVESIDERSVVLVAVHGDARQVLRLGVGTPRATDFDGDEPAPRPAAKAAPSPPESAISQAPVAGSMLRSR
jgi:type IV pilus biogenesis protein PilP